MSWPYIGQVLCSPDTSVFSVSRYKDRYVQRLYEPEKAGEVLYLDVLQLPDTVFVNGRLFRLFTGDSLQRRTVLLRYEYEELRVVPKGRVPYLEDGVLDLGAGDIRLT